MQSSEWFFLLPSRNFWVNISAFFVKCRTHGPLFWSSFEMDIIVKVSFLSKPWPQRPFWAQRVLEIFKAERQNLFTLKFLWKLYPNTLSSFKPKGTHNLWLDDKLWKKSRTAMISLPFPRPRLWLWLMHKKLRQGSQSKDLLGFVKFDFM